MKPLTESDIKDALTGELASWKWKDDKLHRSYTFGNFKEAIGFLVQIGFAAEAQAHHPEIFNVYNRVDISLTTHDADSRVTQKDVTLARSIEEIYRN